MLKTLRITSVLVVVLAVGFLVLPAVFGVRRDEGAEQFLSAPGATEQFNKAKGEKLAGGESQVSPLVKEAEAFALYLNPPKPKTPPRQAARERSVSTPRPAVVSAKFNLVGTSYHALRPELSLALIDEPGKGFHWVRQAGKVGHLIVEKIEDGLVVVRDGQRTFELEVQRPKKRSLVKGFISDASITSTVPANVSQGDRGQPSRTKISLDDRDTPGKLFVEVKEPPDSGDVVDEFKSSLRTELQAARADEDLEEVSKLQKLISDIETMRVSDQEARRLSRLGQKLQHVQQDPNHPPDEDANDGADEETQSEPNKAI